MIDPCDLILSGACWNMYAYNRHQSCSWPPLFLFLWLCFCSKHQPLFQAAPLIFRSGLQTHRRLNTSPGRCLLIYEQTANIPCSCGDINTEVVIKMLPGMRGEKGTISLWELIRSQWPAVIDDCPILSATIIVILRFRACNVARNYDRRRRHCHQPNRYLASFYFFFPSMVVLESEPHFYAG